MEAQGGAVVLLEQDATAEILYRQICDLLNDADQYNAMRKALYGISVPDSAERLCAVMEQLAKKKE